MRDKQGVAVGDCTRGDLSLLNGVTPTCLLYTSPSPRDRQKSRMPSSGATVRKDKVYYFPYSRLVRSINEKLSREHSKVLHDVVIQDVYPERTMDKLSECLDFISEVRWR